MNRLRWGMLWYTLWCIVAIPVMAHSLSPGMAAITDDFQALRYNPAALPYERASGIGAAVNYHANTPHSISADLFLNSNRLGYQLHVDHAVRQRVGLGVPLGEHFALGAALELEEFNFDTLDVAASFLLRPWRYLSIGAQATLEALREPRVDFSIGLRPFTDYITIGVGSAYYRQQLMLPTIMASIEPVDGIRIDGGFDIQNSNWHVALSVAVSSVQVGSEARMSGGTTFAGTGGWVHVAPARFPSIFDAPPGRFVEYNIGTLVDQRSFAPQSLLASFDSRRELVTTLNEIADMCADPNVRGIVFKRENTLTTLANFQELRTAFAPCKEHQKPIIYYHTTYGNVSYAFAASIADEIYLHPSGQVGLRGFASIRPYLKEFLDTIGVEVTAYRSHPTKSFGDIFTADQISEADRSQIELLYRDWYHTLRDMIADRPLDRSPQETIDQGPYLSAHRALEAGLVDGLLYEHEFDDYLRENYDYGALTTPRSGAQIERRWPDLSQRRVALIHATGSIVQGQSRRGDEIGDISIIETIDRAAQSAEVAAIVLRVESGGGSAVASESIAQAVARAAQEKPVVVWMGGVAASGGYYIAAPAHAIIAPSTTLTGSIGVVALVPTIVGLSENLGITWDGVRGSPSADFAHPGREASETERSRLNNLIDNLYDRFTEQVAEYRGVDIETVDSVGQGLIWSGDAAHERGLIDKVGGYHTVLEELKQRLNSDNLKLVPYEHAAGGLWNDISQIAQGLVPQLPQELKTLLRGEIEALFVVPWYPAPIR